MRACLSRKTEKYGCSSAPAVGLVVPGEDRGDRVRHAELSAQLEPVARVDDRPGVGHGDERGVLGVSGELEDLVALEEEGALLRVVQRVAEVDVDLAGVRLDLAEVGVGRRVEGQVVGQADLAGKPDLGQAFVALQPAVRGGQLVAEGDGGQQLDHALEMSP